MYVSLLCNSKQKMCFSEQNKRFQDKVFRINGIPKFHNPYIRALFLHKVYTPHREKDAPAKQQQKQIISNLIKQNFYGLPFQL